MNGSQNSDKGADTSGAASAGDEALPPAYRQLHNDFRWNVPEFFNIAQACCARWAAASSAPEKIAVYAYSTGAAATFYTYADLQTQANQLANGLRSLGVAAGDRVAIVMPQCFETAVAYIAVLQMGAVAMPLSLLFGPEALEYRLQDSGAVVAIGDATALGNLALVRPRCPALRSIVGVRGTPAPCDVVWHTWLAQQSELCTPTPTRAIDPAVLIYTSGTTGNPKGALIAHQALIGNVPGFVASQNWFGFDRAVSLSALANPDTACRSPGATAFWSPADWAWTGGLMDALLPTLFFGSTIVAFDGRFSAQAALDLMGRCGVTHTFLFPTALKAMMKAFPGDTTRTVRSEFSLQLRAIMSAGEAVGDAVFAYCAQQLGVQPNEMFGQTEINYIVGNCVAQWPARAGSMGMGYPGHRVRVIDDEGQECAAGMPGDVAVHRFDVHGVADPVFFLGYWNNAAATKAKFTADWCRTGDLAVRDAQGYLWYQGRSDDVFKSAGYRIGPGEIENCLVKHPAVANAAVVPKPDRERGAVVKAYVVIAPNFIAAHADYTGEGSTFRTSLAEELQAHVKGLLAPYEYPKEIEFVDALPMTTTGKVQRRVLRLQEQERAAAALGGA